MTDNGNGECRVKVLLSHVQSEVKMNDQIKQNSEISIECERIEYQCKKLISNTKQTMKVNGQTVRYVQQIE